MNHSFGASERLEQITSAAQIAHPRRAYRRIGDSINTQHIVSCRGETSHHMLAELTATTCNYYFHIRIRRASTSAALGHHFLTSTGSAE
jgi:hypothetical protein